MVARILFPAAEEKKPLPSQDPTDATGGDSSSNEEKASSYQKNNAGKQAELALALYNKGRKSWTKGAKDEALGLFRKAVALQESSLGYKHPQTAQSYYFLGYALSKHQKEYGKSLIAYRRTLKSRLWTNGNEDVSTEDVQRAIWELLINRKGFKESDVKEYFASAIQTVLLEKKAKGLAEQQEYEKAVEAYEECLSTEKQALGHFPPDIGRLYTKIGAVQRHHKEYEMGLNAYRNALAILVPTLGKDHADSKRCLEGIEFCAASKGISKYLIEQYLQKIFVSLDHCKKGDELVSSNDLSRAMVAYESARFIEEDSLGKYPLTAADIRQKLASIYNARKEYDRVIFELRTVMSIIIFDCGGDHPAVMATVQSIAAALKDKGLHQDVITRYTNTVSFSVKHERYGEHLLTEKKDFSGAIEEFQKSLALEVALGKYHLTQGALFKSIGDAFMAKENYNFAVVNYRNALLVYLSELGKDSVDANIALAMIGSAAAESVGLSKTEADKYRENVSDSILLEKMADTLAAKGDTEESIECYEKAVALEESSLVEYHLSTASLHGKIATLLKKAQQYDRAIVRYRNILSIYLRALGGDHPNTQTAHDELVDVVSLQGLGDDKAKSYGLKVLVSIEHEARGDEDLAHQRHSQGLGEFRKALEIEENSLGRAHLVTAALYGKLADGCRLNGRTSDAIQEYRRAIRIYIKHESPQHDAMKLLRGVEKCIEDLGFSRKRSAQYGTVVWESVKSELSGDAAKKDGDRATALHHYHRSISLEESVLGKLHFSTSLTYKKIADLYRDNDDIEAAIVSYSKVLAIREAHLGKDDEKTIESYDDLMNATQRQAGIQDSIGS